MAHNLFSDDMTNAVCPALAMEVFHNFTLLHDDIMDNASKRRNHDTVHVKWNKNIAILSGDAMMILAYRLISGIPGQILPKILDLFSKTALEVCEGQQYDMNFEKQSAVSIENYLDMIRLKTAVLIAASLAIGAITGKADEETVEKMYRFGLNIGIGFQLQDDYLDVYARAKKFGKNIGSDILSNKKTFLLISALHSGNAVLVNELKHWMEKKDFQPEEKINAVRNIYDQLNIKKITEQTTKKYFNRGLQSFRSISVPDTRKENLRNFVEKMIAREY
jgi:geranylgeranyl diphosphate synthase type II